MALERQADIFLRLWVYKAAFKSPYDEEVPDMTDGDMERISSLKQQGKSAAAIAEMLRLPLNTVKSYLRRHPGTEDAHTCPQCGKAVMQNKGRKEKRFCSDRCRMGWWNAHQSEMNKKAYYTLVCQQCGKEFVYQLL